MSSRSSTKREVTVFTMAFLLYVFLVNTWLMPLAVLGSEPAKAAPELNFHPKPKISGISDLSLIWYKASDQRNVTAWSRVLEDFLELYRIPGLTPGRGQNIVDCDYYHPPLEGQVCKVDVVNNWHPCTAENHFGYHTGTPCVILSLDKMFGWQAEFYNNTETLPSEMPNDLKDHIATQKRLDRRFANQLWVSCKGENPADEENIGPIKYIPAHGFPGYFFPFENVEGNFSPLVAVNFERPLRGIIINVECKIWAHNVKNSGTQKEGTVHFELLID